jgi:hypothetical protein
MQITMTKEMTITEFKEKVVTTLNKNFERFGKISPVFVYVTPTMEFKSVSLEKLVADSSKEYVALFLKEYVKKEKPLFTAYIANSKMKQLNQQDLDSLMMDIVATDEPYRIEVIDTIAVDVVSATNDRILINFKSVGTPEEPQLQMINEIQTKLDKGTLPYIL